MRHSRSLAAATLLALVWAAPVVANHVEPVFEDGATSCGPLSPGTVELVVAVPQEIGSVTDEAFSVDVTLEGSVGDGSLSFSNATLPVKAAFVAGVDGGNLYTYDEPVTEDTGLTTPNDEPIADVSFCYVQEGEAGASPEPPAAGETDAPASPEAPAGGAGEPSGEVADSTAAPEDGPPATDAAVRAQPAIGAALLVSVGLALVATGLAFGLAARPIRRR